MPVDLAKAYAHPPGISWATYPNLYLSYDMGKGAIRMDSKLGDKITVIAFSLK